MFKTSKTIILLFIVVAVLQILGCKAKEPAGKYTDAQLEKIPHPQLEGLPDPTGGLVLAVNGQTLTAEDIIVAGVVASKDMAKQATYEKFAPAVYPYVKQILIDKVTNLLLYQKAKTTVPESVFEEDGPLDSAADSEIRRYLAAYENNYALAQRDLEKQGYNWTSYRESQKRQLLAQMYFAKKIERKPAIAYSEMLTFYNENKDKEFKREPKTKFLLIDITKADDAAKALQTAKEALAEINGGKDFSQCAVEYSQGIKAKSGGLWETSDPTALVSSYDLVVEAMESMSEGEVSGIIESDERIFIVKLIENTKAGYVPLVDIQLELEKYLQNQKRKEQMDKLLGELFEQANINGLEGFLQYCIQQIYVRGTAE